MDTSSTRDLSKPNLFKTKKRIKCRDLTLRNVQEACFHPWSKPKRVWDSFVLLLVAYCSFEIPLLFAMSSQVDNAEDVVSRVVDSMFWLDIVFNFFTGTQDQWGQMMFDPKVLAVAYLKGWFSIDVLASLPLEYVFGPGGRIIRMLRLARVFRKLEQLTSSARTCCDTRHPCHLYCSRELCPVDLRWPLPCSAAAGGSDIGLRVVRALGGVHRLLHWHARGAH